MSVTKYNKLVRDRIPEIIKASGKVCRTEILSDEKYLEMIDAKLDEELEEYHRDQNLEELADLLELLFTATVARGYSIPELEKMRAKKAAERGGFGKKIFLQEVSEPVDPAKPTVRLSVILEAIELADDNSTAYYDLETGECVWYMDSMYCDDEEENEKLGELIEEGFRTRFFRLPEKFDVHEYSIMENFIYDEIPAGSLQNQLEAAIRGRGAFRRFKDLLRKIDMEQEWYDYLEEAHKKIAIDWCEAQGFNYTD